LKNRMEGIDCTWISVDGSGNVGAFVTAGFGIIPSGVLLRDNPPVEDIEEIIFELPVSSGCNLITNVIRPDDFIEISERGFFVYDWTDIGRKSVDFKGAYEKVSEPLNPLKVNQLPDKLRVAVTDFPLDQIYFNTSNLISISTALSD
jgi:hypothetical protein